MPVQGASPAQIRVAGAQKATAAPVRVYNPRVPPEERARQREVVGNKAFGPRPRTVRPLSTKVPKARSTGPGEQHLKALGAQSTSRGHSGVFTGGTAPNDGVYYGQGGTGTKGSVSVRRGEQRA